MKTFKQATGTLCGKILFFCFLSIFAISCEKEELNFSTETADVSIRSFNSVEIISTGMNFHAPDEIPSGWSTFSYRNEGRAEHFFILVKIPDDKSLQDYTEEVTIPFNNLLTLLRGETPDGSFDIAPWFFSDAFNTGGSGIIDPGKTAVSSVNLEPGNYIIECYLKLPNGDFHSIVGMVDQMTVTEEVSKNKEPRSDISISVDGTGMTLKDEITKPGIHTFSVDFAAGNTADVHLVRIENPEEDNRDVLKNWMYWFNNLGEENEGFVTAAPEGFSFLGGTQELAKGGTTYFQAVLKPGTYALVSEVPYVLIENYYVEFTIN